MKAEFILAEKSKEKEDEEVLTSLMNVTNPTVVPSKGDFLNIGGERFQITGVEWIMLREQINIYFVRV